MSKWKSYDRFYSCNNSIWPHRTTSHVYLLTYSVYVRLIREPQYLLDLRNVIFRLSIFSYPKLGALLKYWISSTVELFLLFKSLPNSWSGRPNYVWKTHWVYFDFYPKRNWFSIKEKDRVILTVSRRTGNSVTPRDVWYEMLFQQVNVYLCHRLMGKLRFCIGSCIFLFVYKNGLK